MVPVLTYHHIGDPPTGASNPALYVSAQRFRDQLAFLQGRGYAFVGPDALRADLLGEAALPRRSVVLTFDDGFADNFELARPILREFEATAVFFITTAMLGATDDAGQGYMSADQLRALKGEGMTIGSHAVHHKRLVRMSAEEARRELVESKQTLEGILEDSVDWLCYPKGSFSREVAETAREVGYKGAFSVIRDNRSRPEYLYWLPRVMVMRETEPRRLGYMLGPIYHWVHARKNRRRWGQYL